MEDNSFKSIADEMKSILSIVNSSTDGFDEFIKRINIPDEEAIFDLLDRFKKSEILIVDDKDTDGTFGCRIIKSYLEALGFKVNVHVNDRHGFDKEVLESVKYPYGLIIIVDSSTNLEKLYKGRMNSFLIIDHHNLNELEEVNDFQIDEEKQRYQNTVLNINNKFPGYEHIKNFSAGFFAYIIFHKYYMARKDENSYNLPDQSRFAVATIYSDMIDTDPLVHQAIFYYLNHTAKHNGRYMVGFDISPKINALRRLQNEIGIRAFYENRIMFGALLDRNYTEDRNVLNTIMDTVEVIDYKNFKLIDLTKATKLLDYNIANFKGIICNKLSSKYKVPTIAVTPLPNSDMCQLSVRSSGIDSLSKINSLKDKYEITGGGHKSASGHELSLENLKPFLDELDTQFSNDDTIELNYYIPITKFEDIKNYNILHLIYYNEMNTIRDTGFIMELNLSSIDMKLDDYLRCNLDKNIRILKDPSYDDFDTCTIIMKPHIHNLEDFTESYLVQVLSKDTNVKYNNLLEYQDPIVKQFI